MPYIPQKIEVASKELQNYISTLIDKNVQKSIKLAAQDSNNCKTNNIVIFELFNTHFSKCVDNIKTEINSINVQKDFINIINKKKDKKIKDKNKPKHPLNSFKLFADEYRTETKEEINKQYTNQKKPHIMTVLGQKWKIFKKNATIKIKQVLIKWKNILKLLIKIN